MTKPAKSNPLEGPKDSLEQILRLVEEVKSQIEGGELSPTEAEALSAQVKTLTEGAISLQVTLGIAAKTQQVISEAVVEPIEETVTPLPVQAQEPDPLPATQDASDSPVVDAAPPDDEVIVSDAPTEDNQAVDGGADEAEPSTLDLENYELGTKWKKSEVDYEARQLDGLIDRELQPLYFVYEGTIHSTVVFKDEDNQLRCEVDEDKSDFFSWSDFDKKFSGVTEFYQHIKEKGAEAEVIEDSAPTAVDTALADTPDEAAPLQEEAPVQTEAEDGKVEIECNVFSANEVMGWIQDNIGKLQNSEGVQFIVQKDGINYEMNVSMRKGSTSEISIETFVYDSQEILGTDQFKGRFPNVEIRGRIGKSGPFTPTSAEDFETSSWGVGPRGLVGIGQFRYDRVPYALLVFKQNNVRLDWTVTEDRAIGDQQRFLAKFGANADIFDIHNVLEDLLPEPIPEGAITRREIAVEVGKEALGNEFSGHFTKKGKKHQIRVSRVRKDSAIGVQPTSLVEIWGERRPKQTTAEKLFDQNGNADVELKEGSEWQTKSLMDVLEAFGESEDTYLRACIVKDEKRIGFELVKADGKTTVILLKEYFVGTLSDLEKAFGDIGVEDFENITPKTGEDEEDTSPTPEDDAPKKKKKKKGPRQPKKKKSRPGDGPKREIKQGTQRRPENIPAR